MATPSSSDISEIEFVLSTTALFQSLDRDQSKQLANRALIVSYDAGQTCMQQGQSTQPAFYMVLSGQAFMHREGEAKMVLFSGNRFGQELLQQGESVVAPFTIQAKSDLRCARITYSDMQHVFDVENVDKGVSVDKVFRRKAKSTVGALAAEPTTTEDDIAVPLPDTRKIPAVASKKKGSEKKSSKSAKRNKTVGMASSAASSTAASPSPTTSKQDNMAEPPDKSSTKSVDRPDSAPMPQNSPKPRTDNVIVTQSASTNEKEASTLSMKSPVAEETPEKTRPTPKKTQAPKAVAPRRSSMGTPTTLSPRTKAPRVAAAVEKLAAPRRSSMGTPAALSPTPKSPRNWAKPKVTPPKSPQATEGKSKELPRMSPKVVGKFQPLPMSPRTIQKPKLPPIVLSPQKLSDRQSEEAELSFDDALARRSPMGRKVGKLGQESFSFLNDSQNMASRHKQVGKLAIKPAADEEQESSHNNDSLVLVHDDESFHDSKTRFEQSLSKFENSLRSTGSAGSSKPDTTLATMQLRPDLLASDSNRSLGIDEPSNAGKHVSSSQHKRRGLISSDSMRSLESAEAKEFRRRLRKTAKGLQGKGSLHSEVAPIVEDDSKEIVPLELSIDDLDPNHASGVSFHESESSFNGDSISSLNDSKNRFDESRSKFEGAGAASGEPGQSSAAETTPAPATPPVQEEEATKEEQDDVAAAEEEEPDASKKKPKSKKSEGKRDKGSKKGQESELHESTTSLNETKKDKKKKKSKKNKDKSKDKKASLLGDLDMDEALDLVDENKDTVEAEGPRTRKKGNKSLRYPSNDTEASWTSYKGRFRKNLVKFEKPVRPRPPLNVAQKRIQLPPDYEAPSFKKSKEDERQISKALSSCFAFKAMPKRNLKALIAAFEPQKAKAGTEIIGKGKKEDCFYLVKDGEVEVTVDGTNVTSVKSNETFGDSNLFDVSSEHKDVTARAVRQTSLFKVNHTTYRSILQFESKALNERKRQLLNKLPLLNRTPSEYVSKMADVMKPAAFEKGEVIPTQVDGHKRLYIVDEGRVKCSDKDGNDRTVKAGGTLGDKSFTGESDEQEKFQADSDVSAFYIDIESFEKAIGPVKRVIVPKAKEEAQMGLRSSVMDTKLLRFDPKKPLTILERNAILALIEDRTYEKGEIILEANQEVAANFLFLKKGMIEAYDMATSQTTMTFVMGPNILGKEIFRAAKATNNAMASSTVRLVASEQVVIGVLPAADYLETQAFYLNKPIHRGWHPGKSVDGDDSDFDSDSDEEYADFLEEDDYGRIKRENLVKKTLLGEGGFGQVWLVFDKTEATPKPYAYKVQSKYELTVAGDADVAVREKNIMRHLRHPNVIRLLASYQDENFLYFLMNLVQGGELYSILHPIDEDMDNPVGLGEEKARFYAFGIADALAYLHRKGYVYRDLKPENVLIDNNGHPILCDFGLAKQLKPEEKTFTMRGTPGYLSPESVLNIGHAFSADHWSLGILICELICGESPFFFFGIDSVDLYRRITEDPFDPPECASDEAIDIMDGLLTKDPGVRLGSLTNGEADIIKHKWFEGMDPTAMRRRKIDAPWKPSLKDPFDASNFEDWTDLEDKTTQNFPSLSRKEAAVFDNF